MELSPLVNNIMKFDVIDIKGKKVGDLTVDKEVFGVSSNEAVIVDEGGAPLIRGLPATDGPLYCVMS